MLFEGQMYINLHMLHVMPTCNVIEDNGKGGAFFRYVNRSKIILLDRKELKL